MCRTNPCDCWYMMYYLEEINLFQISDECRLDSRFTLHHSHFLLINYMTVWCAYACGCAACKSVYKCVCRLHPWWWQTHRLIARKTEQPLVRVNNAIMVVRTRLMTADWGWGGETGDEFNYLERTHISSLTISGTQPPDKDILLQWGTIIRNIKLFSVLFLFSLQTRNKKGKQERKKLRQSNIINKLSVYAKKVNQIGEHFKTLITS